MTCSSESVLIRHPQPLFMCLLPLSRAFHRQRRTRSGLSGFRARRARAPRRLSPLGRTRFAHSCTPSERAERSAERKSQAINTNSKYHYNILQVQTTRPARSPMALSKATSSVRQRRESRCSVPLAPDRRSVSLHTLSGQQTSIAEPVSAPGDTITARTMKHTGRRLAAT